MTEIKFEFGDSVRHARRRYRRSSGGAQERRGPGGGRGAHQSEAPVPGTGRTAVAFGAVFPDPDLTNRM